MILDKTIIIKWHPRNKIWYQNKGYIFTKMGDGFEAKVEDLTDGNNTKINIQCDCCDKKILVVWNDYTNSVKKDGKYYCKKCASQLYGGEFARITLLENSKSFEQWCVENNRQDVLNRWDYELNKCKPSNIAYKSNKKYYFKCPCGLHKSELKDINNFAFGHNKSMDCNQCNSFIQLAINKIGKDFLEKYWDYEKNVGVDPWRISYSSHYKVWIKCQNKDYHGSYETTCASFITRNVRCPYCKGIKVHPLDSLGTLHPEVLAIWSDKNNKSPYEYRPSSMKKVWWKCINKKHNNYYRSINGSNQSDFRCPECQFSKGESRIENWLVSHELLYEPQKEFKGLIGLGYGNLSYDFYLPNQNLLIEYQGIQHKQPIDFNGEGTEKAKNNLKVQKEHDKRKKDYAINHNIKLIEIWYWDFDNIESILNKEI